jgi:hypothetical protein
MVNYGGESIDIIDVIVDFCQEIAKKTTLPRPRFSRQNTV